MTALVTGASGYLGTRLVADLLAQRVGVRAAVRSPEGAGALRAAVRRAGVDDEPLQVVTVSLLSDDGWREAMRGVEEVHHLASPMVQTTDPDETVVPARDGTLRVLRTAVAAGVRRVVMTSSFAAVGYSPKPTREYSEDDWTDPATPGLPAYPLSKVVAERAAWEFMADQSGTELVVLDPTWIAGPTLTDRARSSLQLFVAMLTGALPAVPRQRFGIADVRDVSGLHIAAMGAPEAAGKRYLVLAAGPTRTFLDVANLLRERLGSFASRVPTQEVPGEEPPPLVIHNERAKRELGFRPRPWDETVIETAESLRDLGLVAE